MKCVAISRILDEVDIVEAFVRHTAGYVQHHIFMDNGSRDGTVEILQQLADEGLPITVYQNKSVSFSEQSFMTYLYQQAVEKHKANWVYCLDCDEFIHDRGLAGGMNAYLQNAFSDPSDQIHVRMEWGLYKARVSDDASELLVPKRMIYRDPMAVENNTALSFDKMKIIINARIGIQGVVVDNGGHNVIVNGAYSPDARFVKGACLAHYFERSAIQAITKSTRGWAKVLAAGSLLEVRHISSHYRDIYQYLTDRPQDLLRNSHFMGFRYDGDNLILDPVDYRGGPLRYTQATDPAMQAVKSIAGYLEDLSRRHGQLVDDFQIVRRFVDDNNRTHNKIIGEADPLEEKDSAAEVYEADPVPVETQSLEKRLSHAKIYARAQVKKLRYLFSSIRPILSEGQMPGFDEKYYLHWYRDVSRYPGGRLQHYLNKGWKEGRDPSSGFSTDGYLAINTDVRDSGLNPLLHFMKHGLVEGREGWRKDPRAPAPEPRYLQRVVADSPR